MSATTLSDKFLNAVARWSGQVGAAGVSSTSATTIPLQSSTGLVNGRVYWFTLNRLTGTTKNAVSNTEGFPGIINTATHEITTTALLRGSEGTATAWAAGTLVEILHSAGYMNRFIEGLEVSLNQDGSVKPAVVDGTKVYAADAGSTDAYAITLSPAPTTYANGQVFRFKANSPNTGPATLNVNGLGDKTIVKNYNAALADGDILASQIVEVIYDGTNLQLLSPISNAASSSGSYGMGSQSLRNSNFDVAQRGTSFTSVTTPANNDDTYLLDGWNLISDGNDAVDVSQEAITDLPGSNYAIKLDVETSKRSGIVQFLEAKDAKKLKGKNVSLSFAVKSANIAAIRATVLTWSSTADSITSDVVGTWGATPTWATNWADNATPSDLTVASSWATVEIENIAIDEATVNNLAVVIWLPNEETIGDIVYISQVKLEIGATATTFHPKSYAEEYHDCLRYCWVPESSQTVMTLGTGCAQSASMAWIQVRYPVPMRTIPTMTATGTDWKLNDAGTSTDITSMNITDDAVRQSNHGAFIRCNVSGGLTSYRPYWIEADGNANRLMIFNAEL